MTIPDPPAPIARPRRHGHRLILRASMVLVLVAVGVGAGMGWMMHRARVQREVVRIIQEAGGIVHYDYQFSTDRARMQAIRAVQEPAAPAWLRRWLGDDPFRTVAAIEFPGAIRPEVLDAVGRLDDLLSFQLADAEGLEGAWPAIAGLRRLEEARLFGPAVADPALAALGEIGSLRTIDLIQAAFTDRGILALGNLPRLRTLWLGDCHELTDAGLAGMLAKSRSKLEEFALTRAPGSVARTVRALVDHHGNLRSLLFTQSPVEDGDLAPIGGLRELTLLNLLESHVTDAGVAHLARLAKLKTLYLTLPGVTDAGMKAIGRLVGLRYLDLTGSQVGDAGLRELVGLGDLANLRLVETHLTDAGAATLAQLPRLKVLSVNHTRLTDAGLAELERAPALRMLGVAGTAVTPEGIARFRAARPAAVVTTVGPPRTSGPPPALK